jgi:hypothetical protein
MSVVLLIPVLGRPHRVQPLLENLASSTEVDHRVLFLCSTGDRQEIAEVRASGADHLVLRAPPAGGQYAKKINLGYRESSEEWLFLGADDVLFHEGWLEHAIEHSVDRFHVISLNDLANYQVRQGLLATHSLVRRSYIDQPGASLDGPGVVYHEGYSHNFVDVELSVLARSRGVFSYDRGAVVEHHHPLFRRVQRDFTYEVGVRDFEDDRRLSVKRLGKLYGRDPLVRRNVQVEKQIQRREHQQAERLKRAGRRR